MNEPVEVTAAGNIMVQAMALGEVSNLKQIREVIRNSFLNSGYSKKILERGIDGKGWL